MKYPVTDRVTASSSHVPGRGVSKNNMIKAIGSPMTMSHPKSVVPSTNMEEELRLAYVRLRGEARRVQRAVEEERRRIARELHDEFGQALTGLKFDLAWCGRTLTQSLLPTGGGDLLNKVQAMSESVDALMEFVWELRNFIYLHIRDKPGLSG